MGVGAGMVAVVGDCKGTVADGSGREVVVGNGGDVDVGSGVGGVVDTFGVEFAPGNDWSRLRVDVGVGVYGLTATATGSPPPQLIIMRGPTGMAMLFGGRLPSLTISRL